MKRIRKIIFTDRLALALSSGMMILTSGLVQASELTDRLFFCMRPSSGAACEVNTTPVSFPGLKDPETNTLIRGCYDGQFSRIRDAGSSSEGRECPTADAPIFVDVVVTTHCGEAGQTRCKTGSYLRVSHIMEIQGDPNVTAQFRGVQMQLPSTPWIISASGASDRMKVICDGLPGHTFDPNLRTCTQSPTSLCSELGLIWKNGRCQPPPLRCTSCSGDEMNYCAGYVYVPNGGSCFCEGKNTTASQCKFPLPPASLPPPVRGMSFNRLICPPRPLDQISGGDAPSKFNQYLCQPYTFPAGRKESCAAPNRFNPWTGKCDTPDDLKLSEPTTPTGTGTSGAGTSGAANSTGTSTGSSGTGTSGAATGASTAAGTEAGSGTSSEPTKSGQENSKPTDTNALLATCSGDCCCHVQLNIKVGPGKSCSAVEAGGMCRVKSSMDGVSCSSFSPQVSYPLCSKTRPGG